MAKQLYSADGELLKTPITYDCKWDTSIKVSHDIKGYLGFDVKTGLVKVCTSESKPIRMMKLGKLLKRINMPEHSISLCTKFASDLHKASLAEVKFTNSSKEVLDVYARGPRSCMSRCDAVAVYATDDVCVAYLEIGDKVIARAVVRNYGGKLHYYRIYGEVALMTSKLDDLGATEKGEYLDGAKLLHLRDSDDRLMMPYVDGDCTFIDTPHEGDDFVIMKYEGDIDCQDISGRPEGQGCDECDECGDVISEDEGIYSEHLGMFMCESCFVDCHVLVDGTWYHYDQDEVQETEDDGWVLAEEAAYVEERDEWHLLDNCVFNYYSDTYHLRKDLDF